VTFKHALHETRLLLGIERNTTRHSEKLISALGGFLGILCVYWTVRMCFPEGFMHTPGGLIMVTSMGASAVLLFAVPQGALSQPWAVIGGHLLSAFVGVSCQQLFPDYSWTPALAVGLAVGTMCYLRCIHPPGGATALGAVIGGSDIHQLGFYYLLMPVAINVVSIIAMALAFNMWFSWRRYPAHFTRRATIKPSQAAERQFELTQEDFSAAMDELNSYMDITSESLTQLLELAKQHAEKNITHPSEIMAGHFYSNGKLGKLWSVRQVVDAADNGNPSKDQIIYKIVAGDGGYATGICLRREFQQWARYEVISQTNGHWLKFQDDE
jgi:CBS-domain-containing membrane protein